MSVVTFTKYLLKHWLSLVVQLNFGHCQTYWMELNCVKGLGITKIVKEIRVEGVWGKLKAKKMFPDTSIHKIFETNFSFHVK